MISITIPAVSQKFYSDSDVKFIRDTLLKAKNQYGKVIDYYAKLFNVPPELVYALIYIESAGNSSLISSAGAIGLLQITIPTAEDIFADTIMGRFIKSNAELKKELMRLFPDKAQCLLTKAYAGQKNCGISSQDLLDPDKNLFIGIAIISYLLTKYNNRLDALVIAYNKLGLFAKVKVGLTPEDTLKIETVKETRDYIAKLLGPNGTLSIALFLKEKGLL
ncbi:MAG: transglycosylase SLT domain-containing protein [candidate division WOR-3 bacterium]